ncbi:twin-arginine translocation signal domain-containing protein [Haladaptatus sp. GCM10025893]|uniref:twin-arginine translocation signal domain-containing protein n=1 Tax=Haladaptatus sp. GCM10025893 TaxID=3252659 RepID=UPI00360F5EAE
MSNKNPKKLSRRNVLKMTAGATALGSIPIVGAAGRADKSFKKKFRRLIVDLRTVQA